MKKIVVGFLVTVCLSGAAFVTSAKANPPSTGNAHVTLTVTTFRSLTSLNEGPFVDATTALDPSDSVSLAIQDGMPTLFVKRAADIAVTIQSADASESYKPLAVYFEQNVKAGDVKKDLRGEINFAQSRLASGALVIHNKYIQTGRDGSYEFFVLVQRQSDGAIGLIDPSMINEPRGP